MTDEAKLWNGEESIFNSGVGKTRQGHVKE